MAEAKAQLKSLDSIFGATNPPAPETGIVRIPLHQIDPNPENPYHVRRTPDMMELIDSVRQYGVQEPVQVRPKGDRYELLAGERRLAASRYNELSDIPAYIRTDVDVDLAKIIVTDTNIKREDVLPSERAHAYKLKFSLLKHQGKEQGKTSLETLAEETGVSVSYVRYYLRLSDLYPPLLSCVDRDAGYRPEEEWDWDSNGRAPKETEAPPPAPPLKIKAAVHLSYLRPKEQEAVYEVMCREEVSPSAKQAERLKEASAAGALGADALDDILRPREDFSQAPKLTLKGERMQTLFPALRGDELETEVFRLVESKQGLESRLKKLFPKLSPAEMDDKVVEIVEKWHARQKQRELARENGGIQR